MDDIFGGIVPCICVAALVVVIGVASTSLRIAQEYERGVIFRLGRVIGVKGPGLFFLIPIVDRMVSLRNTASDSACRTSTRWRTPAS